jgi:hypothetical protein
VFVCALVSLPVTASDFENTQLKRRQQGKATSLSPPSSEEETEAEAPPVQSKLVQSTQGKGKSSKAPDQDKNKGKEGKGKGKGKGKGQASIPSPNSLHEDEQQILNKMIADLSHLSALTRLTIFQMLSVVGLYHPLAAQRPDEPAELTHDERTSIFDLESRLSTFAGSLNIEWYQVLEMVGITYESERSLGQPSVQHRQAYHPNRANVSPPRLHHNNQSPPRQEEAPNRRQKKHKRQKAISSRSTSLQGRDGRCEPSTAVERSVKPPQPTGTISSGQSTINDVVQQVVELAEVFGVHPFELLRWGGVPDPEPVHDHDQLRAPRGTRFGNPYTIFTQYRSIEHPRTEGLSIGQWQQETAADYKERYGHLTKDQLEQESQKWIKIVLEHDLRTGDTHAISRYNNTDSVKSIKKAINDVKNLVSAYFISHLLRSSNLL